MAISWGAYQSHVRLGIDVIQSPATVGSSTMSVGLTIRMYAQTDGSSSVYGNWPVTFSGAWTGSSTVAINLGPGQSALIWTTTTSRATSTSAQTLSYNATVSHALGSTSIARAHTIGARPAAPPPKPNAPSAVLVTRNSDTQFTIQWNRNSTYTSVIVQRTTGNGVWTQVGKPGGNAANYVDKTVTPNGRFYYRALGVNAGGTSDPSVASAAAYTTPAAPTGVSATRVSDGIVIDATGRPPYASSYEITDGTTVVAASVTLPWKHTNPSLASHVYTLRAKVGALVSAPSAASNVVELLGPPKAPTNLAPNGAVVSSVAPLQLGWKHTPADASAQTAYQLRWRKAGTTAWTERAAVVATSESATFPSPTAIFGDGDIEWQARTKGQHADYGPYSATATFTVAAPPSVSITSPVDPWAQAYAVAGWAYSQDVARPQSAWEAELYDGDDLLIDRKSGTGATATVTMAPLLVDDAGYTLRVRAATGTLWSDWDTLPFSVSFIPPAEPDLGGQWDEETGTVSLNVGVVAPDPGGGPVEDTVAIDVLRSVDGGRSWEPLLTGSSEVNAILADPEALSNGQTMYRAIAYSALGATASTEVSVVAESIAVWLNGGEAFALAARLPYNPSVKVQRGRARALHEFDGRAAAVAYSGSRVSRSVQHAGVVLVDDPMTADEATLDALAVTPAPVHLLRDPTGRRMYGVLSEIDCDLDTPVKLNYSFTIQEAERDAPEVTGGGAA